MTRRRSHATQWCLAGAILVSCSSPTKDAGPCPASPFAHSPTLVIAHAAGEGLGPANTIEAARLSIAAGADVLDYDVRMTSDGVLVAHHDLDVANGTEATGKISAMTLAEVQALDAGYDFEAADGTFSFRGQGVRMPTIEAALAEFPITLTSLEIKDRTAEAGLALCTLLTRLDRFDNVYVSSDTDVGVDAFLAACPTAITTVTDAMVPQLIKARETGERWCAPVSIGQPPMFDDDGKLRITAESVARAHDQGLATFTWTTSDPKILRQLAEAGVDGVYTQRPDLARKIFDEFGQ
jgi:glycerophosphoryl diester phosphodiesterase